MFGVGGPELAVIVLIALVVLGPDRIPQVARALARGYREFTKVRRHVDNTLSDLKQEMQLDLSEPELKRPAGRRVPLDQLHAVEDKPAEPLPIPAEDDYLAS